MSENMFRHTMQLKLTVVLILFLRFLEVLNDSNICCVSDFLNHLKCYEEDFNPETNCTTVTGLDLRNKNINYIEKRTFQYLTNLKELYLDGNNLPNISRGMFDNLSNLEQLFLNNNNITNIERGAFENLSSLKKLYLVNNNLPNISRGMFDNLSNLEQLYVNNIKLRYIEPGVFENLPKLWRLKLDHNNLTNIEPGIFQTLHNLKYLNLDENQILKIEDGAFLFLPSIKKINLMGNNILRCGCYLPAMVNYTRNIKNNETFDVLGKCRTGLGNNSNNVTNIMDPSQCPNYSLFQPNLRCQTCSRMLCNESEVANCTGNEAVCQNKISINGVKLKVEKSCSSYRKCVGAIGSNTFTCNKWTNGTSCVACCVGNLCNNNDFAGWTNSFFFYLICTNNSKSISKKINENTSRDMEYEFQTLTGKFEVEYSGLEKNTNIFTIYCTVPKTVTKEQVWQNIYNIVNTSRILRNLGIQQRNMKLIEEACNENNGTLSWPITKAGTTATIPCHANVATRHCSSRSAEYREMPTKISLFTGIWQEEDMSQCNNTEEITRQLNNIVNQDINEGNIEELSSQLVKITEKSVYFKGEDFDLTVNIYEKMVFIFNNGLHNKELYNNILFSINSMINIQEEILVAAEQHSRCVSRMLDIIERIPEKISLEEQQNVTFLYPNFGIGVVKVDKDTFNGLCYGILDGTPETEARSMIYSLSNPDPQIEDIGKMTFISLPKSLLQHLEDEESSTISRITFTFLQDDKLYRVIQKSNTTESTTISSHIIASTIPNIQITDLDEPVNISFNLIHKNVTTPQCFYWHESPGQNPHWSTQGCHAFTNEEKVVCSCNHLTSFAMLMDVYQNEGSIKDAKLLSILSNTGCGISLVCLILTIIIHVCFKNLWKFMASKILVNLCISLTITNPIFLVGFQSYIEQVTVVCKTVAALLHYSLLVSLMWMSVEAFHIFVGLFFAFKAYTTSFIRRSSVLAWGIPAVIVIINLAINKTNNYIRINQVCWLSKISFYASFLTPMVIILISNLIMFSHIIGHLISRLINREFEHEVRKLRVFGIVGLFFLLGLSWILAFFAFGEATELFKYLFVIFNTLQGMFIFTCYCIYKEETRDVICLYISKRKKWTPRKDPKNKKSSESGNEIEDKTADIHL